jgi:hypothetical protein
VRTFALMLAAMALALSACSSGSDSSAEEQPGPTQDTTPSESAAHFTKDQLPQLALQPADAPKGMRYTKEASGRQTLQDVGFIVPSQINQVKNLRLRGIYDATYDSKKRTSDLRLASRLWLFADEDGAKRWFDKTERDAQSFGFEALQTPKLGDDGWAGHGNLAAQIVTYAFRKGNLVVVTSYSSQSEGLSQRDAQAAAEKAARRLDQA